MKGGNRSTFRESLAKGFSTVEDVVYIVLALLLAAGLAVLLLESALAFARSFAAGLTDVNIVPLLDRVLLVLMVVELLYTVQMSFREHVLIPEPFLLVALIAAVRRVIVLTAELGAGPPRGRGLPDRHDRDRAADARHPRAGGGPGGAPQAASAGGGRARLTRPRAHTPWKRQVVMIW